MAAAAAAAAAVAAIDTVISKAHFHTAPNL